MLSVKNKECFKRKMSFLSAEIERIRDAIYSDCKELLQEINNYKKDSLLSITTQKIISHLGLNKKEILEFLEFKMRTLTLNHVKYSEITRHLQKDHLFAFQQVLKDSEDLCGFSELFDKYGKDLDKSLRDNF